MTSSRPHHQEILGRRGILRPIHDRDRVAAQIAALKDHRERHGKEVPSWEETRAYWKPRLEAETWDEWIAQRGKKKREFRPRQRQHAITLRRPLTRSQAERISTIVPGPIRWVEPGEEIVSPVLRYLEEHRVVPTAEEGLSRSIQERWVEVNDPAPFTICCNPQNEPIVIAEDLVRAYWSDRLAEDTASQPPLREEERRFLNEIIQEANARE